MPRIHDHALLLASAWRLGAADVPMPTSGMALDLALESVLDAMPPAYRDGLSFAQGRCCELPGIVAAAEGAGLIETNGTDFLTASVAVDRDTARQAAVQAGLSTAEAEALGRGLGAAVSAAQTRRRNAAT